MKSPPILILILLSCFLVMVSSQELGGQANNNAKIEKSATSNGPIQSLRHFLRDMTNVASGFLTNRLDRLRVSSQKTKERVNQWFRNLFKSNKL